MSKSEEDQLYDLMLEWVDEPPYYWHGDAEVAPEEMTLFAMSIFFLARNREGKTVSHPLAAWDTQEPEKAVVEKLTEGGWTVMLKTLPNPSDVAWAYSPERKDYAGAAFIPGDPKKLLKKATPNSVLICPLPPEMRKIMQEIGPH